MTSFTIRMEVGDVVQTLHVVEAAMLDASPLMQDVLLVMIRSTQLNFEAGGRPRWDDLADSTIQRRFAKGMKGKGAKKLGSLAVLGSIEILRDTGLLLQSVGGGASGAFEVGAGFGESDDTGAVIGTSQPGWQNQFPDTRGWRPAREFILFQDQDEEDIMDMAVQWALRTGAYAA